MNVRPLPFFSTAIALALAFSGAAIAQNKPNEAGQRQDRAVQQSQQPRVSAGAQQADRGDRPKVLLLSDWNYNALYKDGWSVERLMDQDVYGPAGEEIGSVENVIISEKGRILGIVAQVGGFLDIGDTHVFVPWDMVRVGSGLERVTIPVTQETVEDYSTWAADYLRKARTGQTQKVDSDLTTGPRIWKATELLGDDAFLTDDAGYGAIEDLIFTTDGTLRAVVVNAYAGYGGGYRAFPYYGYGYGWTPGYSSYYLGYNRDEVDTLPAFDYGRMNGNVALQNQQSATTGAGDRSQQ